eukprot:1160965-Pelagomonas_calceolata.AAC.4
MHMHTLLRLTTSPVAVHAEPPTTSGHPPSWSAHGQPHPCSAATRVSNTANGETLRHHLGGAACSDTELSRCTMQGS